MKKCKIKLPSKPCFALELENYLTKDTHSRLSLTVHGGVLGFEVEEVKVKVEKESKPARRGRDKRKLDLGSSNLSGGARDWQNLEGTKSVGS